MITMRRSYILYQTSRRSFHLARCMAFKRIQNSRPISNRKVVCKVGRDKMLKAYRRVDRGGYMQNVARKALAAVRKQIDVYPAEKRRFPD